MGILSGMIRTRRYRRTDSGYVWQSEDTHESSVKFDDGTTLTEKMSSHKQNASTITSGTLGGDVVAPASTAYTTNQLRNMVFTTTDPGKDASTSYSNGSIICVYE